VPSRIYSALLTPTPPLDHGWICASIVSRAQYPTPSHQGGSTYPLQELLPLTNPTQKHDQICRHGSQNGVRLTPNDGGSLLWSWGPLLCFFKLWSPLIFFSHLGLPLCFFSYLGPPVFFQVRYSNKLTVYCYRRIKYTCVISTKNKG
jgi:hypothetical protein